MINKPVSQAVTGVEPATLSFSTKREDPGYVAVAMGPRKGENLSMAQAMQPEGGAYRERLELELKKLETPKQKILRAFAPTVTAMSGIVADPRDLTSEISLGTISLFRNLQMPCDGTVLEPGDAFVMSNAGCPAAVATGRGLCIAAHVGRESAIDMDYLLGKTSKPRQFQSIVDSMAECARRRMIDPGDMIFRLFFQIDPFEFSHPWNFPGFERRNQVLIKHVFEHYGPASIPLHPVSGVHCLDMGQLIMRQAYRAGFRTVSVNDRILPVGGEQAYTRHPNPALADLARNIIIIANIIS